MAGTVFQVKTYGVDIVHRRLMGMAQRAGDIRPAWPAVKQRAAEGFENTFQSQGPGWAPLRPSTVRQRISQGYSGTSPILTRSRELRDAYTVNLKYRGTASTITFVISVPYGKYHLTGTRRMPAREVLLSKWYQRQLSEVIRMVIHGF